MNNKKCKQPISLAAPYIAVVVNYETRMIKGGHADQLQFHDGELVLVLGEIAQMPGHVAVVNRDGRVLWGHHSDNFRQAEEDEC